MNISLFSMSFVQEGKTYFGLPFTASSDEDAVRMSKLAIDKLYGDAAEQGVALFCGESYKLVEVATFDPIAAKPVKSKLRYIEADIDDYFKEVIKKYEKKDKVVVS